MFNAPFGSFPTRLTITPKVWNVMRKDAEVTNDRSAFYTSDRVAVRAITRVGFAFAHPEALVRIVVADIDPTV